MANRQKCNTYFENFQNYKNNTFSSPSGKKTVICMLRVRTQGNFEISSSKGDEIAPLDSN